MRSHGGLGLGLALVRHLVELRGGTVRADSDGRGKGATFTVQLPLVAAGEPVPASAFERPRVQPLEPGAVQKLPAVNGLRILIVEDELDTRELLCSILRRHGAVVTSAANAQEALEIV